MDQEKTEIVVPQKPIAPAKRYSRARLAIAFAVSAASDVIAIWTTLAPPLQIALDFVTAFILFLILGRR